jgi:hypothetical protein
MACAENVHLRQEMKKLNAEVDRVRLLTGRALERKRGIDAGYQSKVEKTVK